MKVLGLREGLTDQARSYDFAVHRDQAAIRLSRENDFRQAGHHGRIEKAGKNREDDHQAQTGSKFFEHDYSFTLDAAQPESGKWHDDSAKAVNEQIAREHLTGANRFVLNAAKGQRN